MQAVQAVECDCIKCTFMLTSRRQRALEGLHMGPCEGNFPRQGTGKGAGGGALAGWNKIVKQLQ